eukprot:Gb_07488 [translate_table: standard]
MYSSPVKGGNGIVTSRNGKQLISQVHNTWEKQVCLLQDRGRCQNSAKPGEAIVKFSFKTGKRSVSDYKVANVGLTKAALQTGLSLAQAVAVEAIVRPISGRFDLHLQVSRRVHWSLGAILAIKEVIWDLWDQFKTAQNSSAFRQTVCPVAFNILKSCVPCFIADYHSSGSGAGLLHCPYVSVCCEEEIQFTVDVYIGGSHYGRNSDSANRPSIVSTTMGGEGWNQSIRMSGNGSNSDQKSNVQEVFEEKLKPVNEVLQGVDQVLCRIADLLQQMNANRKGNMNHRGNVRSQNSMGKDEQISVSLINEPRSSHSNYKKKSEEGNVWEPDHSLERCSYKKEGESGELKNLDDFVCTSSVTNSKFLELEVKDYYYESNSTQEEQGANCEMSRLMLGVGQMVRLQFGVGLCSVSPLFFPFGSMWGQASWGSAWSMPLSPVALVSTDANCCASMIVKTVQNSVAFQSYSRGEGFLWSPKTLSIDNPKGVNCDGQNDRRLGFCELWRTSRESPAIIAQEDASLCHQTRNKTMIQTTVIKSWTLVNYSPRLSPTRREIEVKWLNKKLSKMWPFVADAATRVIRQSVELLLEEYRPPRISSMKSSKLFLGNVAPKIEGIQIQGFKKTKIIMDLEVGWGGDPSIVFVDQTLGASLPSQLNNIQVFAVVRMIFQFANDIPCISALVISRLTEPKPEMGCTLKEIRGNLITIPRLSDMTDDTYKIVDIEGKGVRNINVIRRHIKLILSMVTWLRLRVVKGAQSDRRSETLSGEPIRSLDRAIVKKKGTRLSRKGVPMVRTRTPGVKSHYRSMVEKHRLCPHARVAESYEGGMKHQRSIAHNA